jgi:TPR repeat protein
MKTRFIALCISIILLLGSAGASSADSLNDAFEADKAGDYQTAARIYTRFAEQGDAMAQNNLGVMYQRGEGVPQDHQTAVKWYTAAAEQGLAEAQNNLGLMYHNGYGVLQDDVYAHMWANIASSNGNDTGGEVRDIVAERMTPSQIEEAQTLARACVAKAYKDC